MYILVSALQINTRNPHKVFEKYNLGYKIKRILCLVQNGFKKTQKNLAKNVYNYVMYY